MGQQSLLEMKIILIFPTCEERETGVGYRGQ